MVEERMKRSKPQNVMVKPRNKKVELLKRRTAYSAEYLNSDGSFHVELFTNPVHYKDKNGHWKSINNTIIPLAEDGYDYVNAGNAFSVQFARNNQNNQLVRIAYDSNHWIAFSPADKFTSQGSKNGSSIFYKGVKGNTDLKYTVDNNIVKEEIILNKYPGSNTFLFNITSQGVDLVKDTGGVIWIINEVTGERLFYLSKVYAEDANNDVTYNLDTDIINTQNGQQLVVTIDDQWLYNAQYPVVIDPSIGVSIESDISDAYVSSQNQATSYYLSNYLHSGHLFGYGTMRSYIRFKHLPSLPPGAKITKVNLGLFMYLDSTYGTTINLHKVTQPWESANITWSTQPTYEINPIVSNFSRTINSEWSIDITNLAKEWYNGETPNYGVMIRATNESSSKISFYSSNAIGNPIPKLTIDYEIDALGTESFFGFDGNVNVYNGNLVLSSIDVSLPGRGVPIIISRTYNLRSEETTSVGYRWRLNIGMKINFAEDESVICLIDGDGTNKYFTRQTDMTYSSPIGVKAMLRKEGSVFILEEREGIKYYFNLDGYLDKVVDTDNNTTRIIYQTDGNIARIIDSSERVVIFNYLNGKLVNVSGNDIPTVEYEYAGNNLIKVLKKTSDNLILDQVTFEYDLYQNLISVTDFLEQTTNISYSYTDELGRRTYSVSKNVTIDGVLQNISTTYDYTKTTDGMTTIVTSPMGNITEYKINNMGNVVEIIEDKNRLNLITQLRWDEHQNLVEGIPPKGFGQESIYNTIMQYDEEGNLKKVENAKGNNAIYKYNENHDLIQVVDFAGRPKVYAHDPKTRNITTSSDPLFTAVVTNYDDSGNIISQTDPIGLGGNMLLNTNFENWSSGLPKHWFKYSTGGSILQDYNYKVSGDCSVKLTAFGSSEAQRAILISDFFPVDESTKYTLSWYLKTQNVQPINGGATVTVHWYSSPSISSWISGNGNLAPTIGTTNEFIRKAARVNAPFGARYARIALEVNGSGEAWFDNVQFELGSVINQYNLVYNESFELDMDMDGVPDGWQKWAGSIDDVNDRIVTTDAHSGNRSVVLYGNEQKSKLIRQVIYLEGEAGTPIHFSGWSKAEGVSLTGGYYQILIQINYETQGLTAYGQNFSKTTHDWEYAERIVVTKDKFNRIEIYAKLENQTGRAWFDDFSVRLAGTPNSLISKYNLVQNGNFEHDRITPLNWPDEWTIYKSTMQGIYNVEWLQSDKDIRAFSGSRMVKISNVPDWAVVANEIYEPLQKGITYTASGVVKTIDVAGSGAIIKFDILDANNQYVGQKVSKVITGTTDWTRIIVSITLEEAKIINPNAAKIKVAAGTLGATSGNMYFDSIRMFVGNIEIKYGYDITKNYVVSVTNQLGNTIYLDRDNRGNVTKLTDAKSNIYGFTYDALDRIIQIDNPNGLKQYFRYDKNGNLLQIDYHDANDIYLNTNTRYEYNELGLPIKVSDINWPVWRNTILKYDANGNITEVMGPDRKKILYKYDGASRITEKTYVGDSTKWSFDYDANDNLIVIDKNNTGTIQYVYDVLDRIAEKKYASIGNTSNYEYTPMGEIINITDRIGSRMIQQRFGYDYAGNNVEILGPENTTAAFIYDESRKPKKIFVKSGNMHYITYRNYDALGKVIRWQTEDNLGNLIVDFAYEYDKNGNRIKEINNIDKTRVEYGYDNINQLIEERYYNDLTTNIAIKRLRYKYDLLGNRIQRDSGNAITDYSYHKSNEITHINGSSVYHDLNGNLTRITDSEWAYIYSIENQLVRVEKNGEIVATFEYNGEGLRERKVVGNRIERYYYNGDKLTYITDDNNRLRYYFTRDTQGKLLYMIDYTSTTPATYWYQYDIHGNILGLWDRNGVKVANYSYDAWGNVTETGSIITGEGIPLHEANPFKYSSYQHDKETGLYYLKSRYYSPYLGRFITKDPILRANQYVYAGNNPVNFIDPNGMLELVDDDTIYIPNTGVMLNIKTGKTVGKIKPRKPASKNSSKNKNEFVGKVVRSTLDGIAEVAVGKAIVDKISETTKGIGKIPKLGAGFEVEMVTVNTGRKTAKKFLNNVAGPLTVGVYLWDIYGDIRDYDGIDEQRAVVMTTVELGAGVVAGIVVGIFGLPAWGTFVLGIIGSVAISSLIDEIRENWIGY